MINLRLMLSRIRQRPFRWLLSFIVLGCMLRLAWEWHIPAPSALAPLPPALQEEAVQRGRYLARAGNCQACHTAPDGMAYAGGKRMQTPFGSIYTSNITPDPETGIGTWSTEDFWRALHHGRSKNGDFLYPAFPYPNYAHITRADAHAIYLYLRTLPAIKQKNRAHELSFPYNQRALLAVWRVLYFSPEEFQPDLTQSDTWNRGRYLVNGLGHCNACHASRNRLGATEDSFSLAGGLIPMLEWYAPPLTSSENSNIGLSRWSHKELNDFLQTGLSTQGNAIGPMAEVVADSLQHLDTRDINAISTYLKSLTGSSIHPMIERQPAVPKADKEKVIKAGQYLYQKQCADCHQSDGTGMPPHYPRLAGHLSLTHYPPTNTIRMVLNGGFPPSTEENPRPYGMPPFRHQLNDEEIAAVVSYILASWGNHSEPVSAQEVSRYRSIPD